MGSVTYDFTANSIAGFENDLRVTRKLLAVKLEIGKVIKADFMTLSW